MTIAEDLAATIDPHFDSMYQAGTVPGFAYGVLHRGALLYTRGLGAIEVTSGQDPGETPGDQTVFRIASMTKSFTAATLVSLRDEGLLSLDDLAGTYVPELSTTGSLASQVTVRHLLTMGGGFATDDPWGDRQQDLDPGDFAALLPSAIQPMWQPGVRFEYSNLGYAVLGRVIEAVTSRPYRDVVAERLFRPLEMQNTGFDVDSVNGATVATGYVRRGDEWVVEPIAAYGAFAPMGGILSTVADLARWVGAFQGADDGLFSELQVGQRFIEAVATAPGEGPLEAPTVRHYGFGLFDELLPWGRSVSHSGGYPGFGSHMRWHARSGLGIVALGNRTYAPVGKVARDALGAAVRAGLGDSPAQASSPPALAAARDVVTSLLNGWDDQVLTDSFTSNVHQDEPWERRRQSAAEIRERHGHLTPDAAQAPRDQGPAHSIWWLMGQRGGRVKAEILLGPHTASRIQWVAWTSVPDPTPPTTQRARLALSAHDPLAKLGPATVSDGVTSATFSAKTSAGACEVHVPPTGPGVVSPVLAVTQTPSPD